MVHNDKTIVNHTYKTAEEANHELIYANYMVLRSELDSLVHRLTGKHGILEGKAAKKVLNFHNYIYERGGTIMSRFGEDILRFAPVMILQLPDGHVLKPELKKGWLNLVDLANRLLKNIKDYENKYLSHTT